MVGRKNRVIASSLSRLFMGCAIAAYSLLAAGPPRLSAAVVDDFESAENTWRPGDADVPYRLENHQRINSDPHSGQRSELLQISAGAGTHVYFTHELATARIVAELAPSVWVKSNRPGIQFLARVVLPHTTDSHTGQPATALLAGSSYSSVGMWQQLSISDTPQLLSREERALRAQLGPQVDSREAYVDQLLLNVYGGPGQTMVNIDDLQASGIVPYDTSLSLVAAAQNQVDSSSQLNAASPTGTSDISTVPLGALTPSNGAEQSSAAPQVVVNGLLLLVDGRPMFPRIVQWQGEPLEWLQQLGFNTIHTTSPATEKMLADAQRLGLKLLCPPPLAEPQNPPAEPAVLPITPEFSPVLAWHLGSGLATRELSATAALAKQLRLADHQLRRPLVCSPEDESLAYSRQADVLSETCSPLGGSLELKDVAAWFGQRSRLARPGTPLWAVVQTETAPAIAEQVSVLLGPSASATKPQPTIDAGSLRLLTYLAFCSGMRGIEFASSARLDAADNATRQRFATLGLLNLELGLMEPWGAAGNYATSATCSDPDISAVVLNYKKSRLVVAMRLPQSSQFVSAPDTRGTGLPAVAGSVPSKLLGRKTDKLGSTPALNDKDRVLQRDDPGNNMEDTVRDQTYLPSANHNPLFPGATNPSQAGVTTLVVPGVPEDYRVYELTVAGLRPLRHQVAAGGTAIAIEDFLLTSLVLITTDTTVENDMQRRATELAPRAAQLQRALTAALFEEAATVDGPLSRQPNLGSAAAPLATTRAGLQQADALMSTGQFAQAYLVARNAAYPLEHWKRQVWQQVVKPLSSPVSSPLAVSFNTLPQQVNFAASATHLPPGENLLIGGEFENLSTMLQAGWQHFEHARPDLQTAVELSPIAPFAGGHSLHLQVQPTQEEKPATLAGTLVESPPLWVTSAPVPLNAGDIVCIHGQVRVLQPIIGSVDDLMILDSLGGKSLAQRFSQTDGWREFVLYRAAPQAGNLTVTFALSGVGEAWIDDLSIRSIRRADITGSGNAVSPGNMTSLGWPNSNLPRR